MSQKIMVCTANQAKDKIQPLLDEGWSVKFCVAENVSSTDSIGPGTYSSEYRTICGDIVFILEK